MTELRVWRSLKFGDGKMCRVVAYGQIGRLPVVYLGPVDLKADWQAGAKARLAAMMDRLFGADVATQVESLPVSDSTWRRVVSKALVVLLLVGAFFGMSLAVGCYTTTRVVDSSGETETIAARQWFTQRTAAPIDVVERHFQVALTWPKEEARVAIRRALVWGTSAEQAEKAVAVRLARTFIQQFTMEEVVSEITSDSSIALQEREVLIQKAGVLIDG